jgi:hypothetical protein
VKPRIVASFQMMSVMFTYASRPRRDSDLFGEGARNPEAQRRFQAALKRGFQTRDAETDLLPGYWAGWPTIDPFWRLSFTSIATHLHDSLCKDRP